MAGSYLAFVGTYRDVASAEGDFMAVRDFYDTGSVGASDRTASFDAAVIGKKGDGTAKLYTRSDAVPARGESVGADWGLATGLAVALLPAIGIGAAGWTAQSGAGLAAIAGHVSRGMSRADLKDLGELLDSGFAALIVVAAAGFRGDIERAVGHAATIALRPVAADEEHLIRVLDEVGAAITATG